MEIDQLGGYSPDVGSLDQNGNRGAGKKWTDFEISFGGKPLALLLSPNLIQLGPIGMPSATSLTDGQPIKKNKKKKKEKNWTK